MTLLNLWGLIALLSLVILFLIYFLRPNYQTNNVSSTFIWKLSLKYRKKSLPVSKLKNIILIILQVLFLAGLAFMLAKPVKIKKGLLQEESLIIIDASCSMRVGDDGDTRFDRAVEEAREKFQESVNSGFLTTVVIASSKPYYLVERGSAETVNEALDEFDKLIDEYLCEYGTSDLSQAMDLCQDMLIEKPDTKIYVYTDQVVEYTDKTIEIINVADQGDTNIAILNAYSDVIENYYMFTIEAASYGMDSETNVQIKVNGANKTESDPDGMTLEFSQPVSFYGNVKQKIMFVPASIEHDRLDVDSDTVIYDITDDMRIFSYESVNVTLSDTDSYEYDNEFNIYGGEKETIKILYASSMPNNFVNGALLVIQDFFRNRYEISLTEYSVSSNDNPDRANLPFEGYDIYFYEHEMLPYKAPKDGVVVFLDPKENMYVEGAGFTIASEKDLNGVSISLTQEEEDSLLDKVYADNITVSRYKSGVVADSFETILSVDSKPAVMYKDDGTSKEVVWLFSLHYSNLPLIKEFPLMLYNIFNRFYPVTIPGNSFEVNDEVTVNTRSNEITITGSNDYSNILYNFPAKLSIDLPGTYSFYQLTDFSKELIEDIFVRIPEIESDIYPVTDSLSLPVAEIGEEDLIQDLLFYFAIAISLFAFVEWLLKGNESA